MWNKRCLAIGRAARCWERGRECRGLYKYGSSSLSLSLARDRSVPAPGPAVPGFQNVIQSFLQRLTDWLFFFSFFFLKREGFFSLLLLWGFSTQEVCSCAIVVSHSKAKRSFVWFWNKRLLVKRPLSKERVEEGGKKRKIDNRKPLKREWFVLWLQWQFMLMYVYVWLMLIAHALIYVLLIDSFLLVDEPAMQDPVEQMVYSMCAAWKRANLAWGWIHSDTSL